MKASRGILLAMGFVVFLAVGVLSACGDDDDDDDNDDTAPIDDDATDDDATDDDLLDDDAADDDEADDDDADDDMADDDDDDNDNDDNDNNDDDASPVDRVIGSFVPPTGPTDVQSVNWLDDVNGDGVPEVLAHAYDSIATPTGADHTWALSVSSDKGVDIIWGVAPNSGAPNYSQAGGYGERALRPTSDLNGDGKPDVLLGTVWGNRSAYALSGVDGAVLWQFSTYTNPSSPESGWILDIRPFPDVTADGVAEAVVGVGSENNSGWLLNGATGDVLFTMDQSDDAIYAVGTVGDVDGDGSADAWFAGGDDEDNVYCASGDSAGSADLLWTSETNNVYWGIAGPDLDNDTEDDVLVGSWGDDRLYALSGKDGTKIWQSTASLTPQKIVEVGNLDANTTPDLALTALFANQVYAINGKDGTTLWTAHGPAADEIWAVDAIEDLNDDGVNDVVAGSFDSWAMAFDGATGELLWSYDTGTSRILAISGLPDLNGNGYADVAVGTQYTSDSPGAGTVFILEGKP